MAKQRLPVDKWTTALRRRRNFCRVLLSNAVVLLVTWRPCLTFTVNLASAPSMAYGDGFGGFCGGDKACGRVSWVKAASEADADSQAEVVSRVVGASFVAKVVAAALLPYSVRCAFDVARGLELARPMAWQVGFAAMWALGTIANAIPGRFDGRSAASLDTDEPVVRFITPAGWAFAVWAPIFLGEFLAMIYLTAFAVPQSGLKSLWATTRLGSAVAPGWCTAIAAQIGWCATFRPQLGKAGLWISTVFLGLTSILLGGVHHELCALALDGELSILSNAIVRIPITLHFGWITCATLVNFNNWMANNGSTISAKLAAAYSTVGAAVAAATYVSVARRDPIYAFVVTWSLCAIYKFSERDGSPKQLRIATLCGAAASLALVLACVIV